MFGEKSSKEKLVDMSIRGHFQNKDDIFLAKTQALADFATYIISLHSNNMLDNPLIIAEIKDRIDKTFTVKTHTTIELK